MGDTAGLSPPPPPSIKPSASDGDWVCDDCGNINFARRNACNRCSKSRGPSAKKRKLGQEIGKAAAEKSRGLFSADDWQCNKCGNVNWARRQQCNVCNAPKFGEVEERTGFGGGYNDRGVVEYKERQDSDDEYDEFGRRKKRKNTDERSNDSFKSRSDDDDEAANGGEAAKKAENEEEEEDENDDDDDDDDGDLSKYDLSDFTDTASANNVNRSSRSKSRSRSRSPEYRRRY